MLEESPGEREGYLILYIEDTNRFALAYPGPDERPVECGIYGRILDAFAGT